ncbi:MAG TPA: phage tail sheath C-terminal domain-containing protein [Burkholderiaceae bacterium]|nr:phage tail sheath C-terminal domain-containing protein [Burkholderiaceae bacterium]
MIEPRYPGVFLTEVAFNSQSIEGVSTSTADCARLTSFERLAHAATAGHAVAKATPALGPDSQWKYVSLRRYFAYLEESIDNALQSAVFEPNGSQLWADVSAAVGDFLCAEWQRGALQGSRPDEAFFVTCDRSTMTQDDLDHGRAVLLVGVATVRPSEFVILRFSVQTATPGT